MKIALCVGLVIVGVCVAATLCATRPAANTTVAARCEARNPQPRRAHCPHWRMAMPDVCGVPGAAQPSFVDPCLCMCDLCQRDADCAARAGGRCVRFPSTLVPSTIAEQATCVYPGDACYPNTRCPRRRRRPLMCFDLDGTASCEEPMQDDGP